MKKIRGMKRSTRIWSILLVLAIGALSEWGLLGIGSRVKPFATGKNG